MQRWTAILFVGLLAGACALVVFKGGSRASATPSASDAGAPAVEVSDAAAEDLADAGVDEDGGALDTNDAGGTLLTGETPPALAGGAPQSVVFGAILVTYRGAQGAPAGARSREEALELAQSIAKDAKVDFKAAVAKGDKGSLENAGRLPRGILEPAPEFVLFSLEKGGVSDPVDSPRGYLILTRIE